MNLIIARAPVQRAEAHPPSPLKGTVPLLVGFTVHLKQMAAAAAAAALALARGMIGEVLWMMKMRTVAPQGAEEGPHEVF